MTTVETHCLGHLGTKTSRSLSRLGPFGSVRIGYMSEQEQLDMIGDTLPSFGQQHITQVSEFLRIDTVAGVTRHHCPPAL